MKSQKLLGGMFLCSMILSFSAFAEKSLTPGEILLLMEASKGRYENISATIDYRAFNPPEGGNGEPVLRAVKKITAKKTRTEKFWDVRFSLYNPASDKNNPEDLCFRQIWSFNPKSEKRLTEEKSLVNGEITKPGRLRGTHFYTVYEAIWGLCSYRLETLAARIDTALLSYNQEKSCYLLELRIHDEAGSWQIGTITCTSAC